VVGVTLGVLLLGEALTWELVLGTLLIVSGVWGVNRR
jgi:drug/metabolite transporter (DMT)-like permease